MNGAPTVVLLDQAIPPEREVSVLHVLLRIRRALVVTLALLALPLVGGCRPDSSPDSPDLSSAPLDHEHLPTPRARDWKPAAAKTTTFEQRLAWNEQTTWGDYLAFGQTNALWDADAKNGMTAFARLRAERDSTNLTARLRQGIGAAHAQGCRDPLVEYLYLRVRFAQESASPEECAAAYRAAADGLATSAYSPIRKFYSALRAATNLRGLHAADSAPSTARGAAAAPYLQQAFESLRSAFDDADLPLAEAVEAIEEFRPEIRRSRTLQKQMFPTLAAALRGRWPDQVASLSLAAKLHKDLAWAFRGNGYSNEVTDDGWQGLEEHLTQAATLFERAWNLGPTNTAIPIEMLGVVLSLPSQEARMETWFRRAMDLDPNCYDACHQKAWFLLPKWHGSVEEVLAFGRECVASKTWGGRVPLVLVDAHQFLADDKATGLKDDHWKQPGVWDDVRSAYEKFFQLNPDATSWYPYYARYAYRCGQFAKFNELLPRFGDIDYEDFGGREKFEEMVRTAKREVEK